MIVHFKSSTNDLESLSGETVSRLFRSILHAHQTGNHIAILSRTICEWALNNVEFDRFERAAIRRLQQNFTQNGQLIEEARFSIGITINQPEPIKRLEKIFLVRYDTIINSRVLDPSCLIVENGDSDGKLYQLILDNHAKTKNLKNLCFDINNGGGAETSKEFERQVSEGKIAVCICDSDMIAPGTKKSETLTKAMRISSRKNYVGAAYSTICHEAENHIPIEVVLQMYPNQVDVNCRKLQKLILEQENLAKGDCLWHYYDCKDGFRHEKYSEFCKSKASQNWISKKYGVKWNQINRLRYPGFGNYIIRDLFENYDHIRKFCIYQASDLWKLHFRDFFEEVYWFLVAARKTYAT